jgi:hypothetical protein
MRKLWFIAVVPLVLMCFGCGSDESTNPKEELKVSTLLTDLEYPTGLWVKDAKVYFTETNGRNTGYGGKVALSVYDTASKVKTLLVNDPENSDAVVVDSDVDIYLTSYHGALPGDVGKVSVVDHSTLIESPVCNIEIASIDMYIDGADDIYIIGTSDNPSAKSVYLLRNGSYDLPEVLHTGLGRTRCMSKSGSILYYANLAEILRFVGGTFESFATKGAQSMSFSSKYLFYAEMSAGKVGRINISTKSDLTLASGLHSPLAVRWDGTHGKLYFLEAGTDAGEYKDGTLKVITGIQ